MTRTHNHLPESYITKHRLLYFPFSSKSQKQKTEVSLQPTPLIWRNFPMPGMSAPIETHWYDDNAYSTKQDVKQEIEAAVRAQAPADAFAAYIA